MNGFRTEPTTIGQYIDDAQNETIKTDQAVQRDFCWTNESINNLIYSAVSQKICIPNLILAEEDKSGITITYVVDGGHRTEALRRFKYSGYKITTLIRNPFVTYNKKKVDENGKIIRDENGDIVWKTVEFDLRKKTYNDLPDELKRQFNKCPLMTTIYQDCTSEETSSLVSIMNSHVAMNPSQKALTYIGKFANEIKKIKDSSVFLKDSTALTENEKHKGIWERVISESVMAVFYMNEWKKDPKRMCDFLNNNSSIEQFRKIEEYFSRIAPYSDKIDNKEVSDLFVSKDMAVWMVVFDNFTKFGLDDSKFGEFLNEFVTNMRNVEVDGTTWNDLDMDKHTKDKSVLECKINHITYLMKNYLHIEEKDNEAEMENNVLDESAVSMASENEKNGENDTVLAFCKENVSTDIEEEDVELYEAMLDDYVRIDSPIYSMCRNALIGLIGFSVRENKDEEFEDWIKKYQENKSNFSPSQKINFVYMKNDFNNYLVQRRGVING
ncbi:DUF262 domain-containing protein [Lachnospiraceae bacterium NSJ-171]|nr:DUF262 domain-containing protein [Lachnospiraceae bacterium NSJ-171]